MNSLESNNITVWPRTFIVTETALQLAPHPKLSPYFLKKILPYVKDKAKNGSGKLSQKMWRHICVNKLQMSEELGNFYFEYFLLLKSTSQEKVQSVAVNVASIKEVESRRIDVYAFICFLFFQQYYKMSLKSSYSSSTNEWPALGSGYDANNTRGDTATSATSRKIADEQSVVLFFIEKLGSLLDVLAAHTSGFLGVRALVGLEFLFEASSSDRRQSISDIAQRTPNSGYNREAGHFTVNQFNQWLCGLLVVNPFGMQACLSNGRKISCPVPGMHLDSSGSASTSNIMTVKAKIILSSGNYEPRSIVFAYIAKQTMAKTGILIQDNCIKLVRCTNSYIYLLDCVKSVHLVRCKNTTLVVGAVATVLSVNECKNMRIIAACGKISVQKCENSSFHLLTNTAPLLLYGNEGLTFSPFNTWYASFTHHLTRAGISLDSNLWNKIYCPAPEQIQSWSLGTPGNFNLFAIPFAFPQLRGIGNENSSAENIVKHLPSEFQHQLQEKMTNFKYWSNLSESITSEEQKQVVTELFMSKFKQWLTVEGHRLELDSLTIASLYNKDS